MDENRTMIIRESIFDDPDRKKRQAALVVLQGEEIGRHFRLQRTSMVIGRSHDAHIRLPDQRASRRHARIDYRGTGTSDDTTFFLTDLESTNRTFVNAEEVESVRLGEGDKIRIGDTILKFVVMDGVEAKFHEDVRDLISYDRLTGLLTKESLFLAAERELERCLKYDLPLSVLMMDLDRFKSVNDTHGHLMGSHVLSEVGKVIHDAIRCADVSARYGGEEFVSYLAETGTTGARMAAERIREAVEEHSFVLDDRSVRVTMSIGVASAPEDGTTLKELVGAADEALYRAKATGRNRVCMTGA